MFEEIGKMKEIKIQQDKLSQDYAVLASPKLTDMSLISNIFNWFCESKEISKEELNVPLRDQFVFIVLYLYSPEKLMDKKKKMKNKLRITLNEVLGITSKNVLSNECDRLYSNYKTIKTLRKSIDESYLFIKEKLESSGLAIGL